MMLPIVALFAVLSAAAAAPITDPLILLKEADRREENGGWKARQEFLKGMIADLGARITTDPKDARAYALRGLARLQLYDDGPQTRADLDEAIRLDPANALAYSVRCRNKMRTGAAETAIEDCDKAVALEPANPLHYEMRSDLRRFKGSWDDAIADLDKA